MKTTRIGPRGSGRRRLAGMVAGAAVLGAVALRGPGPGGPRPGEPEPSGPGASEVVGVELPLEVNDAVRKWIRRFTGDQRVHFERWLSREARFGEFIRERLRARGMPEDLLYLAMIESGFSPRAYSRARASGLWQFMDGTARLFGLRVDYWVDERRDPLRATGAALDYLGELHDRFGSWYLAAAAYNAGHNRVERVLRTRAGGRSGDEGLFWEIQRHLPRETREYVPRMIAAAILARDPGRFGFSVEPAPPYRFQRVFVPGGTSIREVARAAGVPWEEVRALNPHLVRGVTPPGEVYPVRVPVGRAEAVVAALGRRGPALLALVDD